MEFDSKTRIFSAPRFTRAAMILIVLLTLLSIPAAGQSATTSRKVRNKVVPTEPELARKINLVANVKVQITISPSGSVTEAKAVGGHPLLIAPSVDAAKQWRYEPGSETTVAIIEFHYGPSNN